MGKRGNADQRASKRGDWYDAGEQMTYQAPEDWKRLRYSSEAEYRAAVEARAREIWVAREAAMWGVDPKWRKYMQSWESGSELARDKCLVQAERELGQ